MSDIEIVTDSVDSQEVYCNGCGMEPEEEYIATFMIGTRQVSLCRNCSGTIVLLLIRYWGVL